MENPITFDSDPVSEWANFELGEDVRDERRLEQDRLWAQAVADGRVHLSHREFALLYAPRFTVAIEDYYLVKVIVMGMYSRKSILRKIEVEILTIIVEYALPGQGPLVRSIVQNMETEKTLNYVLGNVKNDANEAFRICVRKRPLLPFERAQGSYEVAHVSGNHSILLHEGKLARNGRLLSMSHHQFAVDNVYDENTSNDELCRQVVDPLLSWAERGNKATMLCFGQTGTGKTYTLYGALEYISKHLVGKHIRLIFYEVHGNKCYDLLQDRALVHLRFDESENLHVRGARSIELNPLKEPRELLSYLKTAIHLRSTLVTERNSLSSRSHAVCSIEILTPSVAKDHSLAAYLKEQQFSAPGAPQATYATAGKITLVDLAGSERNYETLQMSAAQHKESADINLALMSLKDCFRAYHSSLLYHAEKEKNLGFITPPVSTTKSPKVGASIKKTASASSPVLPRIPYRNSTLTKVLKECFTTGFNHHTTIVATISPTPVDLQHTLNTIQHVLLMSSNLSSFTDCVNVEVPKTSEAALSNVPMAQWSHAQVLAWLGTVERGRFAHIVLPAGTNGERLLQLTISNFAQLFEEAERVGRQAKEGPVWTISIEDNSRIQVISLALYNAIRREEYIYSNKMSANSNLIE
jgi:hypothetical protein